MRIIIPILGFGKSGGDRVLSQLANHWLLGGHDVAFIVRQGETEPYFPTNAQIIATTSEGELDLPGPGLSVVGGLARPRLLALYKGLRALNLKSFDVVLANHNLTTWPVLLSRVPRSKRFYYIQAYEPDYSWSERRLLSWAFAKASYLLPFTQIANAQVYGTHIGIRPCAIVPAGIDLAAFHPKSNIRDFADGHRVTLGCIGRVELVKGTRYVLDAFVELAREDPSIHLRVAYDNLPAGWSHPRCEIIVPRNDQELSEFYRSLDIMIAPGTVQHGAPHYPVMEAMACAVPVVTTGYLPAHDNNAWLVPNRDSHAIVRAVQAIRLDPNYHDRVERGIAAMRSFAWPVVATSMIDCFQTRCKRY